MRLIEIIRLKSLAVQGESRCGPCGTGILPVKTRAGSPCHYFYHRLLVFVALVVGNHNAFGDSLTFFFSGNLNYVHESLNLDESVYVGATFTGEYVFDPTGVVDVYPDSSNVGFYRFASPARMSARIGNYEFFTHDLGILIWNDLVAGDLYQPISNSPFQAAGYQWNSMLVQLGDDSGEALDSDALPTEVPDLSAFSSKNFGLFLPGDDFGIGGRLTSLTPEPGSLALFALGATMLYHRRNR